MTLMVCFDVITRHRTRADLVPVTERAIMSIMKRTLICLYLALLELACASPVFATDQVRPQHYPSPCWCEIHWSAFGWIFPLVCFVMMVVICVFVMRRNHMGCTWRGRSTDKSGFRDS